MLLNLLAEVHRDCESKDNHTAPKKLAGGTFKRISSSSERRFTILIQCTPLKLSMFLQDLHAITQI
jgi:hypothetical protein